MRLSLWNFIPYLEDFEIRYEIPDGRAEIEGIQLLKNQEGETEESCYVYISYDEENPEWMKLRHGDDCIRVRGTDLTRLLNRVLKIFSDFNIWENDLRELERGGSLQKILDKGTEALQNPMVLSDLEGNVLAMSTEFLEDSSSPGWVECREKRRVPEAVLTSPVYSEMGKAVSWSEKPQIFTIEDGQKIIGDMIMSEGGPIGTMALWERKRKINPGDLWLVTILNRTFLAFQKEAHEDGKPFHSITTVIENLMDGLEVGDDILKNIRIDCESPWILELAEDAESPNKVWQKSLIRLIRRTEIACIPTIHDGHVIWMTSEKDADRLLNMVIGKEEQKYFCLIRSMPFESLDMLNTRYRQVQYIFRKVNGKNGIYDGVRYGFDYMMDRIASKNVPHALVHPALRKLYQYDQAKGGDLYESLYYYLLYEQSIQKGADAVHVHRNTYLYRIQRIRELTGIDTDDPKERAYLLFSYMLENAKK